MVSVKTGVISGLVLAALAGCGSAAVSSSPSGNATQTVEAAATPAAQGGSATAAPAATASPASPASPVSGPAAQTCNGSGCTALASQKYGTRRLTAVDSAGSAVGLQPVAGIPAEDWRIRVAGTVGDFHQAGIIGPVVGEMWPSAKAYEYEYAPRGIASGRCLGVAGTAITLRPCGVGASTLWVALTADRSGAFSPLITATDTRKQAPLVLTATSADGALTLSELSVTGGAVAPAQMWQPVAGLPAS
jgi:hypothetical protein